MFAFDHVDDGALGCMIARTAFDRQGEQTLDMCKIGHLRADLMEVSRRDFAHLVATGAAGAAKPEDAANLFGAEAKLPRLADEAERAEMVLTINAVAARGPRRRGDHPDLFEVTDRLDVDARAPGKLADGDAWHKISLDPVATTGGT